jgi:hypothetical protein
MFQFSLFLCMLSVLLSPQVVVQAQDLDNRQGEISSLEDGQAARGIVPIQGNTQVGAFLSWELNFGYSSDTTGTWFLIAEGDEPIEDGLLSEWDTTRITDGIYNLRLTIFLEGGRRSHTTVEGIRVRNYTPIETNTPIPTFTSTPYTLTPLPETPTATATETPVPASPTPLPTNPLVVPTSVFSYSILRGMAGALAFFVIIGLYTTIKRTLKKS